MAYLTVIKGPDQGRKYGLEPLTDPAGDGTEVCGIGRDPRNAIRLHDTEISRQHAELRRVERQFVLRDLGSSNGTYVNGRRVRTAPVRSGDKIRVGQTELIFHAAVHQTPSDEATAEAASRITLTEIGGDPEASAIIRSIKHSEGSQFLRYPEQAGSVWLRNALVELEMLYETTSAISRIQDVDQLLDHILDMVFRSIRADRGCILLRDDESGALLPTAIRHTPLEAEDGSPPEPHRPDRIEMSQSIIDWVLDKNEGVLVVDASHDRRFSSSESILQLGIREAICVPLRGRHETLGVMYIDTKSDRKQVLQTQKPIRFDEDYLKLMIAIAYQAGLAIEDSRYYQAMLQAERLAAIGQTIATLSHHIKNILQGLRSGSYLIEMGLGEQNFELLEHGWGVVQKNQAKIYDLVMDMLSYSKEREPVAVPSDLNEICQDVAELMASRARELNAHLETELDPEMPQALVDPEGIHRAVLNITTNALDAVEGVEGGRVDITTRLRDGGRYAHIEIHDNGMGIPADKQARIFNIFESTKGSRGSGLGLAVSQKIVREHGGRVRVVSDPGEGACFIIELPLRRPSAEPTREVDEAPGMPATLPEIALDEQDTVEKPIPRTRLGDGDEPGRESLDRGESS